MSQEAAQESATTAGKDFDVLVGIAHHGLGTARVQLRSPSKKSMLEFFRESSAQILGQRGTIFSVSIISVNDTPVTDHNHTLYFAHKVQKLTDYMGDLIRADRKNPRPHGKVSRQDEFHEILLFGDNRNMTHIILSERNKAFAFIGRDSNVTVYNEVTGGVLFDQKGLRSRRHLLKPAPKIVIQ